MQKEWAKFNKCHYVKYGLHYTDFQKTHNLPTLLCTDILYQILLKHIKKYGKVCVEILISVLK